MGPYDLGISVGSSNNNSGSNCFHNEKLVTPDIDGLLASDAVLYSMLNELNQSLPNYSSASHHHHHLSNLSADLELIDSLIPAPESLDPTAGNIVWSDQNGINQQAQVNQASPPAQQHQMTTTSVVSPKNEIEMSYESSENVQELGLVSASSPAEATEEEDPSIRLVHLLMTCAEAVQHGHISLAAALIEEMRYTLTRVNTLCGIGKVAGYFIDALARRVYSPSQESFLPATESTQENEFLYHQFYEACPFLKFAHFTANQAILEAFQGHDYVHVIDFNLVHGLQWPALIQALALRPGGPPVLRLTGIGPPSTDGSDSLREIGLRIAEVAWSVNVKFTFRGVAASRLDDVKPWMLQVKPFEAVAVNSIMQLHRLLGTDSTRGSPPIDTVLSWIRSLNPKIVTVVEQEADHNQPGFLSRFTEALYYYSTIFDSLDACGLHQEKAFAEMYIQKEICNVLSCEGISRVERHEPLIKWRNRLVDAGFGPLHLGSNALKQARMLLTLFSAEGYSVEETEGFLTLNWQSRPLIAASAWQPFASD
ncbi:hypothetical protein C5167_025772 [Papaver somniferum]|uniref:Uncharacterized protein n=1 Tax=Papaver somniferum TaxID=3469 RepID=A0A4Y7JSF7_PAPSO|nr:DELLA protein GAIP-like [Papaver somniferum]RZC64034.1 hypothetical protein C5167_025772 [Papaver somniferum]